MNYTRLVQNFDDNLQLSIGCRLSTFHVALENVLQSLYDTETAWCNASI